MRFSDRNVYALRFRIAELEAEVTRLAMENSHNIGKLDIEERLHKRTKDELGKAEAAMDAIHGDSGLLGRRL